MHLETKFSDTVSCPCSKEVYHVSVALTTTLAQCNHCITYPGHYLQISSVTLDTHERRHLRFLSAMNTLNTGSVNIWHKKYRHSSSSLVILYNFATSLHPPIDNIIDYVTRIGNGRDFRFNPRSQKWYVYSVGN